MVNIEEFYKRNNIKLQSKEDEEIIINSDIKVKMYYYLDSNKKVRHIVTVNELVVFADKSETKATDVYNSIPNIIKALEF